MVEVDYTPDEIVLTKLPEVTLVTVIGPTAVGKTTLMNAAAARCPALHLVLTTTNRAPRPDEQNDVDFHFRSSEEIELRIAERRYVQIVTHPTGELYATAPEDYSVDGVAVMAVLADVMPIFEALPFKTLREIFVLPPSWEQWQTRILTHRFTPDQREKRLSEAKRSLRYALDSQGVVFVINDDLAQTTMEFTQAALGAKPVVDQVESRKLAENLLKQLQNY